MDYHEEIPNDAFRLIFKYLNYIDLNECCLVCKQWAQLITESNRLSHVNCVDVAKYMTQHKMSSIFIYSSPDICNVEILVNKQVAHLAHKILLTHKRYLKKVKFWNMDTVGDVLLYKYDPNFCSVVEEFPLVEWIS